MGPIIFCINIFNPLNMKLMLNPLIVYGVGLCETSIRHPNLYTFSNELQSCNDLPHQQILNSYIYI